MQLCSAKAETKTAIVTESDLRHLARIEIEMADAIGTGTAIAIETETDAVIALVLLEKLAVEAEVVAEVAIHVTETGDGKYPLLSLLMMPLACPNPEKENPSWQM